MNLPTLLCACALCYLFQTEAVHLPRFIKPCKASDPQLSKCVGRVIESLRPYTTEGIKQFQLPPIDPLYITSMSISREDSAASYNAQCKDIVISGGKNFELLENEIDLDLLVMKLKLAFPTARWSTGSALVNGVMFGFPLNGTMKMYVDLKNLTMDFLLYGNKSYDDGQKHVNWKVDALNVTYDSMRFSVYDIFEDEYLLRTFNNVVNTNTELLDEHVKPVIASSIGNFIVELINRVHRIFPQDILYPTD